MQRTHDAQLQVSMSWSQAIKCGQGIWSSLLTLHFGPVVDVQALLARAVEGPLMGPTDSPALRDSLRHAMHEACPAQVHSGCKERQCFVGLELASRCWASELHAHAGRDFRHSPLPHSMQQALVLSLTLMHAATSEAALSGLRRRASTEPHLRALLALANSECLTLKELSFAVLANLMRPVSADATSQAAAGFVLRMVPQGTLFAQVLQPLSSCINGKEAREAVLVREASRALLGLWRVPHALQALQMPEHVTTAGQAAMAPLDICGTWDVFHYSSRGDESRCAQDRSLPMQMT